MKNIDVAGALRDHHGPDQSRDHVLLLDDDPSMIGLHKAVVMRALPDHKILEAEHPPEALAHLMRDGVADRIAIILTDLNMPYMTGDTFAMLARGQVVGEKTLEPSVVNALKHVPILMLTTDNSAIELRNLVNTGVLQHVGEKGEGGIAGIALNMKTAIEKAGPLRVNTNLD